MILIHPSSLSKLMPDAKSKKPRDLSVGAQTYCRQLAKEFVYGYRASVSTKHMEKGTRCEDESIALYNEVNFTNVAKNPQTKRNQWLVGTCDIDTGTKIVDIKSSWSLATFPCIKSDADDSDYAWQGRGYMMLWDRDVFELAFCMVSTPLDLIGYEDKSAHIVDHIDPAWRVTTFEYERDLDLEEKIMLKVESAQRYIEQIIDEISTDHAGAAVKRMRKEA